MCNSDIQRESRTAERARLGTVRHDLVLPLMCDDCNGDVLALCWPNRHAAAGPRTGADEHDRLWHDPTSSAGCTQGKY